MGKMLTEKVPQNKKVRFMAFYLPQFHRTPENDQSDVSSAKPLFKGHEQLLGGRRRGYRGLLG